MNQALIDQSSECHNYVICKSALPFYHFAFRCRWVGFDLAVCFQIPQSFLAVRLDERSVHVMSVVNVQHGHPFAGETLQ